MQERDTDLYYAYEDLDRLEKTNLKHWIAHIIMGTLLAGVIAFIAYALIKR
jgi:hypothetical protein